MQTLEKAHPLVLFADDDVDLVALVQLKLRLEGFVVRTCYNGEGLLDMAMEVEPDIILLDITMNGIDGTDLCRLIKQNKETLHIPIILFSANDELASIALACGADGHIEKPFGTNNISSYIRNILNKK
ncbi:MAG TPA: response regulator [Chitinophagaceae bacterium]|nr:response regulator [Chitinophagaceae bacterium]